MDLRISEILSHIAPETTAVKEKVPTEDFSFTLNRLNDQGMTERLNRLLDDIITHGKKLSEHRDIKDMKQYRGLISDFIHEVVSNSHKFSRENFLDKRGRHRVYGIIRLVNKNLDDLAEALLKKEENNLNILEKVDEIRGLLLDILM